MRARLAFFFSTAWLAFVAIAFSDVGLNLLVAMFAFNATLLWGVVWLARLIVFVVRSRGRDAIAAPSRSWWIWCVEPAAWALSVALIWSGIPAQVRFDLSEGDLHAYVQAVRLGRVPPLDFDEPPRLIGMYLLHETELLPGGIVRIITSSDGFDDAGFVHSPHGVPPVIGEDIYRRLHGAWWHWQRSW